MTRFSLKNDRLTYILLILIAFGGLVSYMKMPRAEDPGFVVRKAQVVTYFPGASPERVEMLVTDKLEEAIQEIPEVDYAISESRTGISIIEVNIEERYKDMRPIWDSLRRKVERVASTLPNGVVGPIVNDEFGDVYGTLLTLTGDGYSYGELEQISNLVRDELLRIPDVAKIDVRGVQEKHIFVEVQHAELAELGLSSAQLKGVLQGRNIIIPGGQVSNSRERIVVEPSGNFETLDDLRQTVITLPGSGEVIYLKDIATITPGYLDPSPTHVRYNGHPSLVLAISMKEGGNIMQMGSDVAKLVDKLRQAYPIGVELDFATFQPTVVTDIVNDFAFNLVQSVILVMVMMLLTLGLRMGFIVSSLIPLTILASFMVMSLFNIYLDQISLAALVIALGLFVDNAIVMAESIASEVQAGRPRKQAVLAAAKELRIPLLTSSLTTSFAFLPIYLAQSTEGEYTAALFQVVTIALLCSWGLSLTATPLFCYKFMKVKPAKTKTYPRYHTALKWSLNNRVLVLTGVCCIFAFSLYSFRWVPKSFFPPSDRALVTMALELPPGSRIEMVDETVTEVETFLSAHKEVDNWLAFIGEGAPRFYLSSNPELPRPEYALILANTKSSKGADRLLTSATAYLGDNFPDLHATVKRLELGPPVTSPVEVRISGPDVERISQIATQVAARLERIPQAININEDWGRRVKKLVVNVDQPRALRAGVTSQDVAISLQTLLNGFETTQFRTSDDLIPVTLRSAAADREDVAHLENLMVFSQAGTSRVVPLSQVADLTTVWEPATVHRRNRQRTVTVSSDLTPGVTAHNVVRQITPWLDQEQANWPPGYRYEIGGEKERSLRANKSILDKVPIAAMAIILLLVAQFNSIRKSLIILLTIPLGIIGVVFGLIITQSYLGFVTFLGVISLSGIVVNNGIVLIDRIRIEREKGMSPYDAIWEASRRRLRPILLTTGTTVGGLLPLVFDGGPLFKPMAIAVVSGLIVSTGLTLFVIPALYSLLFRVKP